MVVFVLLQSLFWSVVCSTDLSLVGDYYHYGRVQCHTDLSTCCSGTQGIHRGDWYFPNGDRLPFPGDIGDIFESRVAQRVDLRS